MLRKGWLVGVVAVVFGCGGESPTSVPPADVATAVDTGTDGGGLSDALTDAAMAMDVAVADATRPDVAPPTDVMATDVMATDGAQDVPVLTDGTDVAMVDVAADASAGPYPAGPYGNRMGDVLANLSWQGYVNATGGAVSTTRPFVSTSLQQLRGSGRGYALVHVSDFY